MVAAVTTLGPQQFGPRRRSFCLTAAGSCSRAGAPRGGGLPGLAWRAPLRPTRAGARGAWPRASSWRGLAALGTGGHSRGPASGPRQGPLAGDPVTLADGMGVVASFASVRGLGGALGAVVYRTGGAARHQLTWVDRSGPPAAGPRTTLVCLTAACPPMAAAWWCSGRCRATGPLAAGRRPHESVDLRSGPPTCFPSGRRTARGSRSPPFRTGGSEDIYQIRTNGTGGEARLVTSNSNQVPERAGPRTGAFCSIRSHRPADEPLTCGSVPMVGDSHPVQVFLEDPVPRGYGASFRRTAGGWCTSRTHRGGTEIDVRPLCGHAFAARARRADGRTVASLHGGRHISAWRPDGKELYDLNPGGRHDGERRSRDRGPLAPGAPVVLFPTRIVGGGEDRPG